MIFINFIALLDRERAWGIFYSVSSEEPQLLADYRDNLHEIATLMTARLGKFRGITSEMILT